MICVRKQNKGEFELVIFGGTSITSWLSRAIFHILGGGGAMGVFSSLASYPLSDGMHLLVIRVNGEELLHLAHFKLTQLNHNGRVQ